MIRDFYYFNPRLTSKLNAIRRKPMTIVSAPEGFGKRAAIKSYVFNIRGLKLWQSIEDESFEKWFEVYVGILNRYYPSSGFSEVSVKLNKSGIDDAVSKVSALLKSAIKDEPLIYVLDMRGRLNKDVLNFLCRLTHQEVYHLYIVVLTKNRDLNGLEKDTDDRINLIEESAFLFDQTDICASFAEKDIYLSTEDAAIIYEVTNGWAPMVKSMFNDVDQYGKTRTWLSLKSAEAVWIDRVDTPENLGYSSVLCSILTGMSRLDSFTIDEVKFIDEKSGGLLYGGSASTLRSALSPGKIPPFVFFDKTSGRYHVHHLMAIRFKEAYEDLSEEDQKSILDAHDKLRKSKSMPFDKIDEITDRILSMDYIEASRLIRALKSSMDLYTVEIVGMIVVLDSWIEALCGRAQYAVSILEEKIRLAYASGQYDRGEILILGSAVMKVFLGKEYLKGMEVFQVWSPRIADKKGVREMLSFMRMMICYSKDDPQTLEVFAESFRSSSRYVDGLRWLFLTIAHSELKRKEMARECLALALPVFAKENWVLFFVAFYERLYSLFPEDMSIEEKVFLKEVKNNINQYRRNMVRNFDNKKDSYGAELTRRQFEVAELAAEGLSNKEIAANLQVSENTVKTTLKMVFRKLNIEKRNELPKTLHPTTESPD